ncbi:hypothetical protein SO802_000920 [Lithocarpus litseifolius]|uniref:ADF-H domain-containing protein n=1 Tax=Lithocarpus litseifolius TaxID=425828 RepID=A0AAW2DYL9_9ROSI
MVKALKAELGRGEVDLRDPLFCSLGFLLRNELVTYEWLHLISLTANAVSGMVVNDECKLKFVELKAKKNYEFIIFKIENQKVVVENLESPDETYEDFTESLPANECHYAVYEFDFISDENCQKSKIFFIAWHLRKGCILSIGAINAIQTLKRAHKSSSSTPDYSPIPSRLHKADLLATLRELLHQDHCTLALHAFSAIQSEYNNSNLSLYADVATALAKNKMVETDCSGGGI